MLRASDDHRAALERLSGAVLGGGSISEAALLHAVFEAGLKAVGEAAEAAGYAELAAQRADGSADARRLARRRIPDWAGEV